MATRMLRRGLPRVPGGEPWPPADASVEAADGEIPTAAVDTDLSGAAARSEVDPASPDTPVAGLAAAAAREEAVDAAPGGASAASQGPSAEGARADGTPAASSAPNPGVGEAVVRLRRGLPRVAGGDPWPPADAAPVAGTATVAPTPPADAPRVSAPVLTAAAPTADAQVGAAIQGGSAPEVTSAEDVAATPSTGGAVVSTGTALRRGLPRTPGGEPWPPAGTVPVAVSAPAALEPLVAVADGDAIREASASATTAEQPVAASTPDETVPAAGALVPAADLAAPLRWTRTVWNGRAPRHLATAPEAHRRRPTWTQVIAVLFGAAALGVLAGAAVAFVRALLSLPFMQDVLAAFPGEYEPAIPVEPGFAPWANWAHFFNMFLMVLIIRSGLQVRTEKRPTVFWAPRNNPKGKISLALWFHQSLDILWLVNGVIFVVLLFVTGHWVRIVPTSWEVFPNALSAALQYVSFDWPHENGWNNYNSLQQLAYFATVFLAAPLAAITGFRMSGLWPKRAERLSKAYPVEWARALHFPIMLYFVAFIIAHVALVMLTGFLRNLNHMFAAQDAVTWTGFWVFVLALVVIAIGWVAARPLVLAPIAKAFGKVSGR